MKNSMKLFVVFFASFILRIVIVLYSSWHDNHFPVKYTDIDYIVFTDAARYVTEGQSPYHRLTYRYTPLLSYAMSLNIYWFESFGKVLFCVIDLGLAYLVHKLLTSMLSQKQSQDLKSSASDCKQQNNSSSIENRSLWYISISILFNPIVFNVSTRGNADQLIVFMVLMVLYHLYHRNICQAAFWYALSIHTKIYPIIYFPAIFLYLDSYQDLSDKANGKFKSSQSVLHRFFLRFFNMERLKFLLVTVLTLIPLTCIFYYLYGYEFIYETYLYHFVRKDNRHNFAVYFYHIYLTSISKVTFYGIIPLLAFLPQFAALLSISFQYFHDLPFAMFIQTYLFVAFNKVCTVQYFVWYLCLLGFIMKSSKMSKKRAIVLIGLEVASQALWLSFAYRLEFLGENTFLHIWIAGILFFISHLVVICQCIRHHTPSYFINHNLSKSLKMD